MEPQEPYKRVRIHGWRYQLRKIIFGTSSFWGKTFDVALLWIILLSVLVVMLESVPSIEHAMGPWLRGLEWFFTILFTLEYVFRIITVGKPVKYIFSFFGIIDLLAILPTYLSFFVFGAQTLLVIRTIRLLRVFRIFKLVRFIGEAHVLRDALMASRAKITIFIGTVLIIVIIMGTLMYLIEHSESGFSSIPRSIYWAIVTLTTVGYGDIAPQTVLGQTLASIIMIIGYAIIAVPTGIVTAEMVQKKKENKKLKECLNCHTDGLPADAAYCRYCGSKIPD